jgi:tRNA-splicing ligase RtcB
MSRSRAKKTARGRRIDEELARQGIVVMAKGKATLAEEMPAAYKDVTHVVGVMERAGIARPVVRLTPLGVVKG